MSLSGSLSKSQVSVSFYRPMDYFDGVYNRIAAWVTAGDFCHCELVLHTTPTDIMKAVKSIYESAQNGEYPPEDCHRMISQIENNFFNDTAFRKSVQTSDTMVLSFSLLWGQPMSVRVLNETSHDSWFKIPAPEDRTVALLHGPALKDEDYHATLQFVIEELGKDYDGTGALCSILPSWSSPDSHERRQSYFCSEFCVMAFQRVGFMEDLPAKHTTPNSLYKYVSDHFSTENS
jgi:hypothetical protein